MTGIIPRPIFVAEDIPPACGTDRADVTDNVVGSMATALANDGGCVEGRVGGAFGTLASRVGVISAVVSARART